MTKSAVRLARKALAVGQTALPAYSSRFSRHDYTQPQLFALLPLKQFLKTDYRGIVALVAEWMELRRALGLQTVPHYSTLCDAERRLLKGGAFDRLQAACFRRAHAAGLIAAAPVVTVDATGLEPHHVSAYFVDRRGPLLGRRRQRGSKLTTVGETASHLIAGAVIPRGPSQDSPQFPDFPAAVRQTAALLVPHRLLGDAGYDAEHNHRLCHEVLGIPETVIALNRRTMGRRWPLPPYRRAMTRDFPRALARERWQAERIFSRLNRRLAAVLTTHSARAQRHEILLRVLTPNLMLLRCWPRRGSTKQNALLSLASLARARRGPVSAGHDAPSAIYQRRKLLGASWAGLGLVVSALV